eukprot:4571526-Alexandrium_andersonii.AAC.1
MPPPGRAPRDAASLGAGGHSGAGGGAPGGAPAAAFRAPRGAASLGAGVNSGTEGGEGSPRGLPGCSLCASFGA